VSHNRSLGPILVVTGLVANNYAFLHDLLWQDFDTIVMGWRWLLAAAGVATALIGFAMISRGRTPA
jgi:hypothetical protein